MSPPDDTLHHMGSGSFTACEYLERIYGLQSSDDIAVADGDGRHSYREFIETVDRLSHFLAGKGISAGDRVAILLGRRMEHDAARLQCLSAGASFISVNPEYPKNRIDSILGACGPCCSLTESDLEAIRASPPERIFRRDIPDSEEAFIVFTSGSTGKPKGVLHARDVFMHAAISLPAILTPGAERNMGSLTDMMFIANVCEMAIPFYYGASHTIIPEVFRRDLQGFMNFVNANNVRMMSVPPDLAPYFKGSTVLDLGVQGQKSNLISVPGINIVNLYGCSEMCLISRGSFAGMENPSIGTAFMGVEVRLVGDDGLDCDKGEIIASGPGMMTGYLNDPERTKAAITADADGRKWLHTGDLGIQTPDGIVVMGRIDRMVKINGQRVEPAEVEFNIEKISGIRECAVVPYGIGVHDKLCLYYQGSVGEEEIRDRLGGRLPAYMVPATIIRMDALPKNRNGKIDRPLLPNPEVVKDGKDYLEPRTPEEKTICEQFCMSLGLNGVGAQNDFVRLGGDSLSAMRAAQYCREHGLAVSAHDFLALRIPRTIQAAVKEKGSADRLYSLETGCPLTGGSLDVFLDIESGKATTDYVITSEYPVPEGTAVTQVREVLWSLMDVHPILRQRITVESGEPRFVFDAVPEITESDGPSDGISEPFETGTSLSRFNIVKGGRIQAAFHHTVFDGMSAIAVGDTLARLFRDDMPEQDTHFLRDAESYAAADLTEAARFFRGMLRDAEDDQQPVGDPDGVSGHGSVRLQPSRGRIQEYQRECGVTPAAVLISAFGYTLSRFAGSRYAVFGNTVDGREITGSSGAVGMFVRTLPLVLDCADRDTAEFVADASAKVLGAIENQQCSFFSIQKESGLRLSSVFNLMANVGQDAPDIEDRLDEGDLVGDLKFDVAVMGDSYALRYTYSDRYSEGTVRRMASAFDRILSGMLSCRRLSEIEYITEEDAAVCERINDTSVPLEHEDIVESFRIRVRSSPDSLMLNYIGRRYTCAEVDSLSDSVAAALASAGISGKDRVAVMVPRSEWYLICAIGVMKTGAAYVPIDTTYPDERIGFMISDSSAKAVLVTPETAERARILCSAIIVDCTSVPDQHFSLVPASPRDTAVVLYTSGTTGKPKGSLITRLAIENLCEWYVDFTGMGPKDNYSLFASCAFDMHTLMFTPIVGGGALDIVPEDVRLDIDALNSHFRGYGCTHTFMTTRLGKMFASQAGGDTSIRLLMYGGEKLGEFTAPDAVGACESYGPSENLAISAAVMVNDRGYSSSVGLPVYNVKAYILDRERRRVPVGAVGELYLSGYQLSSGYLNNPEKNREQFFDNPFTSEEGYERMYATGDYFRLLPDGTLGVIGRRDGQVKIRGNRVELTEVEACIRTIPSVRDVTVQPITQDNGTKELCAYIVADEHLALSDIQSYVSERKPDYMVPAFVIQLDSIPLNVNGKVDRRALPKPDISSLRQEYVPPRNDVENILCEAFAEALGTERIGIEDDFIRLGGDSLKAVKVASLMHARGYAVTVKDIMLHRRVSGIPVHASAASGDGSDAVYDTDAVPLSERQLSLYLDVAKGFERRFNMVSITPIPADTDLGRYRAAVSEALNSVRCFRTRIETRDVPYAVYTGVRIEVDEVSLEASISEATARLSRPFSDDGPMARASIVSQDEGTYLFLDINHLFFDGISRDILMDRIDSAYRGEQIPEDTGMFMPEPHYPEGSEKFFGDMLSSSDLTFLPSDGERTGEYVREDLILSRPASDIPDGYTYSTVVSSAIAYALSKFAGVDHGTILFVDSGREDAAAGDSVGLYMRMLPVSIPNVPDSREYIKNARELMFTAMSYGRYPFRLLAKRYGVGSQMLAVDSLPYSEGLFDSSLRDQFSGALGDITVYIVRKDDTLYLSAEYDGGLFARSTVSSLLRQADRILDCICSGGDLSECDYQQDGIGLLESFNGSFEECAFRDPVTRFLNIASRDPDSPALSYGDVSLTYRELASRCSRTAAEILGICRPSVVAVYVPVSEWYAIAPVSALMAGAAYVPIPPGTPPARVEEILGGCSPDLLISSRDLLSRISPGCRTVAVEDLTGKGLDSETPYMASPDDPFTILHTSGTTGKPKGVVVTHGNVSAANDWYARNTGLGPGKVSAFYVSIGYAPHYDSLFGTLANGAKLVIVPEDVRMDMDRLRILLLEEGVTHAILPQPICRRLLENGPVEGIWGIFAPGERIESISSGDTAVFCDYGQTECPNMVIHDITDRCSSHDIGAHTDLVRMYLLDSEGRRVPVGAMGEICASGPMVALGYLGGERFPEDSFHPGHRMRRTGDMGRFLPNGHLELYGRIDGIVKIRGNRVEIPEVETCIRSMPGIREAAVKAVDGAQGGKELCAYVVADGTVTASAVQQYVSERKPQYMVPSFVIPVGAMPLNANGKVDKRQLPEPDVSSLRTEYRAPRSEAERTVCDAFSEALSADRIGIDDDFIRMGGDSLKAIRAVALCRQKGFVTSVPVILSLRTPARIAAESSDDVVQIYTLESGCPLTGGQLEMYLASVDREDQSAFILTQNYPTGDLGPDEVQGLIRRLIGVFPIMKARVSMESGEPYLIMDASPEITVSGSADGDIGRPFDPQAGLCRFHIVPGERVQAAFHHMIQDASSMRIISKAVSELQSGADIGTDLGFLRDASAYTEERADRAVGYFRERFSDVPGGVQMVFDESGEEGAVIRRLSSSREQVSERARALGTTSVNLLMQAFGYAISRFSGDRYGVFYDSINSRDYTGSQDSVGMFVHSVPTIIDCGPESTADFLSLAHESIIEQMSNQYCPAHRLFRELGIRPNVFFNHVSAAYEGGAADKWIATDGVIGDMMLYVIPDAEGYSVKCTHSAAYSESTVRNFLEAFDRIIKGMLVSDRMTDIGYVSDEDIGRQDGINSTEIPLAHADVLETFSACAERDPDRIYVSVPGKQYTYGEQARISDGLASALGDAGIGRGSRVAVMVPRSEWYCLCPLAVLKRGAAYIPIDTSYPDDRISFMLSDSGADCVMVTPDTAERARTLRNLPAIDCTAVHPGRTEEMRPEPGDPAVILYTSGTTGKPKGTVIPHLALESFIESFARVTGLSAGDTVLFYHSFGFDVHIQYVFGPSVAGARCDIPPEDSRTEIDRLAQHISSEGISIVDLPTSVLKVFVKEYPDLPIRLMIAGGEKLGPVDADTSYAIMDTYGPTEYTVEATHILVSDRTSSDSVGVPYGNTKAYVLDRELRRVPTGAVGELYLSGYQLQTGYLNNPGKDRLQFVDNPFCRTEGYGRMYATGDYARILPDGTIGIVGRKDLQVKIRGNRVETAEVEAVVRSHPDVEDVTVQPIDSDGGKELCAYVKADRPIPLSELQEYVSARCPGYMVPAFAVMLDSIPLTSNGKVDRRALPLPDMRSVQTSPYAAPRNDSEAVLCDQFARVLGTDRIGLDDDFIQLGGDSLKAIKVSQQCRRNGISVRMQDILTLRTPRALSSVSADAHAGSCRYTLDTGCPLTGGQLDVYLDIMSEHSESSYVIDMTYPISEEISAEKTRDIVSKLLDGHPVFRSRIILKDDAPWLLTDTEPEITVSDVPDGDMRRPFDMSGPLSRFHIVPGKCIQGAFHHIVSDAITRELVIQDLDRIIRGDDIGTDLGFLLDADLYTRQQSMQETFFTDMFADVPDDTTLIPYGSGEPGFGTVTLTQSADMIDRGSRELGTTSANLLAAAFGYTLSRFTGSRYAVFSHIVNGRELTGSERSCGMFVRTLPIAMDCRDDSVRGFLSRQSQALLGTISNQVCQFHRLSKILGLNFGIVFNHFSGIEVQGNRLRQDLNEKDIIGDLTFNLIQSEGRYLLVFSHSKKYSNDFVSDMARTFDRIVTGLLTCERLSEIQYVSQEDIELQERINNTSVPLKYRDILEAFRARVAESPGSVLLTYLDNRYTYAEADSISDSIASALSSAGISRGDSVAIMIPRSEWYLLCVLGVLKTGAAYVPVDTSYPDERVGFMISDSSAKAVLVTPETKERASALTESALIDCTSLPSEPFGTVHVCPDDTAVVLYTSGTTGKPKGSIITRFAIENFCEWYVSCSGMTSADRAALHTSIAFDMHAMALFPPLVAGASVDIIPENVRLDTDMLHAHIQKYGITHIFITTQFGKIYASSHPGGCLRVLFVAGEKLGSFDVATEYSMFDGYGPSENLALSTGIRISCRSDPSSVGTPNSNVKAYILDKEHRRIPYGAVGELYLSGYQLSKGYLNRPDRNKEQFFDNPFSAEKGYGRMYATGDYFRFLPDGTLGIIGRRDGQVKIRGNRVELTEVEACIRSIPSVRDVTVQPIIRDDGAKELCAYIVQTEILALSDVQSYVQERKPDYMVPAFVVQLDSIPLNVNGKIDRKALPMPDTSVLRAEYAAPRNDTEKTLCEAFGDALGIADIGINDDFIRLGGDSLKAIKVSQQCRRNGISVRMQDILTLRTPRALSSVSADAHAGSCRYTLDTGCPLAGGQLDVYLDIMSGHQLSSYVIDMTYPISEEISAEKARDIVSKLLDGHPVFRSRIILDYGNPWMRIDAEPEITVSDVPDGDMRRPFDMSGPLSRFHIVPGKCIQGAFHHIVSDAITRELVIQDLDRIIRGEDIGTDLGFLRDANLFSQYCSLQKAFFTDMFADVPDDTTLIPYGSGEPGFGTVKLTQSADMIDRSSRELGTTSANLLAAAFGYTLSRFTGSRYAVFSHIVNGRELTGSERSCGMFVRTLPIAMDCRDDSVRGFLSRQSQALLGTISNQVCQFHRLSKILGLNFGIMFNHISGIEVQEDGMNQEADEKDIVGDLTFNLIRSAGQYLLVFNHSKKYSNAFVSDMARTFDRIVTGLLTCEKLSEIQYVSQEDMELQERINDTSVPLQYGDIIEAFRSRVKESPNSVLLTYLDNTYTRSESDSISDAIASALSSVGISRGDSVAVMVPRSEWYLLCALGVIKAGAAYVPVDTSHPDERIGFIISDSSAKAVIVTPETKERASALTETALIDCTSLPISEFGPVPVSPEDTAVILYTSGTTGIPKGALITRKGICNLVQSYGQMIRTDDILGLYHSYGFDAHMKALFSSVIAGVHVDIIPEDKRTDIDGLCRFVEDRGISCLLLPTSVGKLVMNLHPELRIRCLILGGEKLGSIGTRPAYGIIDTYGPTEYTATVAYIDADSRILPESVGRPVANTHVYILDSEHRRVPCGAVGELYLSGYQISKGYLNRPDRDKEQFFDNPFSSEEGYERMYATGDFFRFLPDGTLGIIGRRDGQVKVRGNRVELTEVEECLRSMPSVENVTVQPITQDSGTKELCAYIVQTEILALSDVQSYVQERKPDYMVPAFVVQLDSIPLNVNGKVDRKALPMPDTSVLRAEYAAPRNDAEKALCEAFGEVLGIADIGIHDDFIRLGGDSLKAIALGQILGRRNIAVKISDVMAYHTPEAIALRTYVPQAGASAHRYSVESGIPIVGGMLNLYVDTIVNGGTYGQFPIRYPANGRSVDEIKEIIGKLVAVHPILRGRLGTKDGAPWLYLDTDPVITIGPTDESLVPVEPSVNCFSQLIRVDRGIPQEVVVLIHHLIFDHHSQAAFEKTLAKLTLGEEVQTDLGFIRYAELETDEAVADTDRRIMQNFSRITEGGNIPQMIRTERSVRRYHRISADPDALKDLAREHDISVGELVTAQYAYTVSRFNGLLPAPFSMIIRGRDCGGLEDSIGMFAKAIPARLNCEGDSLSVFLGNAVGDLREQMSNQFCSFRKLLDEFTDILEESFNYVRQDFDSSNIIFDVDWDCESAVNPFEVIVFHDDKQGMFLTAKRFESHTPDMIGSFIEEFDHVLSNIAGISSMSELQAPPSAEGRYTEAYREPSDAQTAGDLLERAPLPSGVRDAVEDIRRRLSQVPKGGRVLLDALDHRTEAAQIAAVRGLGLTAVISAGGTGIGDTVSAIVSGQGDGISVETVPGCDPGDSTDGSPAMVAYDGRGTYVYSDLQLGLAVGNLIAAASLSDGDRVFSDFAPGTFPHVCVSLAAACSGAGIASEQDASVCIVSRNHGVSGGPGCRYVIADTPGSLRPVPGQVYAYGLDSPFGILALHESAEHLCPADVGRVMPGIRFRAVGDDGTLVPWCGIGNLEVSGPAAPTGKDGSPVTMPGTRGRLYGDVSLQITHEPYSQICDRGRRYDMPAIEDMMRSAGIEQAVVPFVIDGTRAGADIFVCGPLQEVPGPVAGYWEDAEFRIHNVAAIPRDAYGRVDRDRIIGHADHGRKVPPSGNDS